MGRLWPSTLCFGLEVDNLAAHCQAVVVGNGEVMIDGR